MGVPARYLMKPKGKQPSRKRACEDFAAAKRLPVQPVLPMQPGGRGAVLPVLPTAPPKKIRAIRLIR